MRCFIINLWSTFLLNDTEKKDADISVDVHEHDLPDDQQDGKSKKKHKKKRKTKSRQFSRTHRLYPTMYCVVSSIYLAFNHALLTLAATTQYSPFINKIEMLMLFPTFQFLNLIKCDFVQLNLKSLKLSVADDTIVLHVCFSDLPHLGCMAPHIWTINILFHFLYVFMHEMAISLKAIYVRLYHPIHSNAEVDTIGTHSK